MLAPEVRLPLLSPCTNTKNNNHSTLLIMLNGRKTYENVWLAWGKYAKIVVRLEIVAGREGLASEIHIVDQA
jgi:hypothetical protein